MYRVREIQRYDTEVLLRLMKLSKEDVDNGKDWRWRLNAHRKCINYNEMVFKFWLKPESFYPESLFKKSKNSRKDEA
jgi:hypothetical protein